MIYYVPIEPYDRRYTADWIEQFERAFTENGKEYQTILGEQICYSLTQKDTVLDPVGTCHYKTSQISKLISVASMIKDDDVVFFADLWFPGIECLFYIRNMLGAKFKICGILHAGTYDDYDFTCRYGMKNWGKSFENMVLKEVDKVFVATEFHKKLIESNSYPYEESKVIVTGIPFYAKELKATYQSASKENIVVFPHRIAEEKRPELFDELENEVTKRRPDIKFIKTIQATKSRKDYFELLARSKVMVSFAEQETFGYSTVEAMALGNICFVPDKLSYKETVPKESRYSSVSELVNKVVSAIDNYNDNIPVLQLLYDKTLEQWANSINNMIDNF